MGIFCFKPAFEKNWIMKAENRVVGNVPGGADGCGRVARRKGKEWRSNMFMTYADVTAW